MKFIPSGRIYIDFETSITDDIEALDWVKEMLVKISFKMEKNSCLASKDYNLGATKQDVLNAIAILDLLSDYDNCYIEYGGEN